MKDLTLTTFDAVVLDRFPTSVTWHPWNKVIWPVKEDFQELLIISKTGRTTSSLAAKHLTGNTISSWFLIS